MEFERFSPTGELIEVRTTWRGDQIFGVVQAGGAIAGYGWAFWSLKAFEADQMRAFRDQDYVLDRSLPFGGVPGVNEAGRFTPDYRGIILILATLAIVHLAVAAGLYRGSRIAYVFALPLALIVVAYAAIGGGAMIVAAVAAVLCALYSLARLFGWIGPKAARVPTEE